MKNTLLIALIALPILALGQQQPGFCRLYSGEITGTSFADITWDGEKLITTGQFVTDTAPNKAINGLLYMELDTNGNTLFTDIYFHPNDAMTPNIGNCIYQSNNGLTYAMGQILRVTSSYVSIYGGSKRLSMVEVPVEGLQSYLYYAVDWNENLLFSGRRVNLQNNSEGMLIKSDPLGNEIWRKYYGIPGLRCVIGEPYIVDDNTIILPSYNMSWPSTSSILDKWGRTWMITLDSLGNIKSQWESQKNKEIGVVTRIFKTTDGNWLYVSKELIPDIQKNIIIERIKIICRDANFNLVWEKYLSNVDERRIGITDIIPTSDGNFLIVGKWNSFAPSIGKISPKGDFIWSFHNVIPSAFLAGEHNLGGVVELPSGSVVAAGFVQDFSTPKAYGILVKLDKNGCMDTLCKGQIGTHETELALKIKVYPNPTSEFLTISNPIGEQIEIFDLEGRLILTEPVNNETQTIQIQGLPSGVYMLRMKEKTLQVSYQIIKQ